MKILFMADGGLNHTWRWVEYFAGRGHDIHLMTLEETPADLPCTVWRVEARAPGARLISSLLKTFIGKKTAGPGRAAAPDPSLHILQYLFAVPAVRKIVGAVEPDIVNAQQVSNYGMLGAMSGFHPLAVTALGTDVLVLPRRSWLDKKRIAYALSRADLITSMADHMTEVLTHELGADRPKIIVNHFGLDPMVFAPTNRPPRPADEVVLISTRHFRPVYNLEQLIRALPKVFDELTRALLVMYSDGPERPRIEELARELDVADRVDFRGSQPMAVVAEGLRDADIYVNVSRSDGANISLLEGMICGCYPVCSDIPACTQWVADGGNGTVIPLDDPDALARVIIAAARDVDRRAAVRKPNEEIVRARGLLEDNMRKSEEAFIELVKRFKAKRQR
jgi:glycosyltransferase involved in cell wall biosynthesis